MLTLLRSLFPATMAAIDARDWVVLVPYVLGAVILGIAAYALWTDYRLRKSGYNPDYTPPPGRDREPPPRPPSRRDTGE